jgi:hypothetical protein
MTIRVRILVATTAIVFAFASVIPLQAAMPVSGSSVAVDNSDIIQVAKKKRSKKSARQEADESAEKGTVPSRYRSSVPKQYHQYIPFAK